MRQENLNEDSAQGSGRRQGNHGQAPSKRGLEDHADEIAGGGLPDKV